MTRHQETYPHLNHDIPKLTFYLVSNSYVHSAELCDNLDNTIISKQSILS